MKLIFVGPHGAGKGTQARILCKSHGFSLFESSHILRLISKETSNRAKEINEAFHAGAFVSQTIMSDILDDILSHTTSNIILDGFLRTMEAQELLFSKLKDGVVVIFSLSYETAISRLSGRMYDPLTGETFKKGTQINPITKTFLIQKPYDIDITDIKQRMKVYDKETVPVIEFIKKNGVQYIEIDASGNTQDIDREIKVKLGLQ